ncbi:DUF4864 domain-containing protein [Defluviimonas sp. SAOS-178_SWC]|uniref:DUF4864 domain-containing protein n=1 Tax=Defluviimonas sp. SAOS-178_SWC TaxID=3121287 RepID=UPI003221A274
MRHAWVMFLSMWLASGAASGDDGADIRSVIGNQIAAFEADDLATAFGYASSTIRGIFGSPENFGRMVAGGYPMIRRPDAVSYLGLRVEEGRPVQRMGFRDAAGAIHLFDYLMVDGPDGWRIDGVYPVPETGAGV